VTCRETECDDVMKLVDAGFVRAAENGTIVDLEQSYDRDSVEIHNCRTNDPGRFPFPSAKNATGRLAAAYARGYLRVGALGPSDWGVDGNYTADPPTGFWPEVLDAIGHGVLGHTGLSFRRVFFGSSDEVMQAVLDGSVDVTEPYWTVSSWYLGEARKYNFAMGCFVVGSEHHYFTRKATGSPSMSPTTSSPSTAPTASPTPSPIAAPVQGTDQKGNDDGSFSTLEYVLLGTGAVLVVLLAAGLVSLHRRNQENQELMERYKALAPEDAPKAEHVRATLGLNLTEKNQGKRASAAAVTGVCSV